MLLELASGNTGFADESTKDELVYARIFTAIVEHRLLPGVKLPEDALAESFGVSRTVIRKALHRLAIERLVTIQPKRGAAVSKPTVQEARNVFAARRLIEVGSLDLVVEKIRDSDIAALRAIAKQEHQAHQRHDARVAINLSGQFHVRILAIAGNDDLNDFLVRLVSRSSLILAVYGSSWDATCDNSCHDELIELLAQRDLEGVKALMLRHLIEVESGLNMALEEDGEPDFKKIFSEMGGR
ncbi:GntR family transcriptional regulator [Crenobacter cavernae]|uniref:GntR family transcriptional regulator n=1 Tax=Crenobacter cavernae TaxID=2290923 RepID=A0ABY0FA28_9NEIS|nr:GntR family transcriptional regulator [Crenobacter cavernae]RXZ42514.1 GntR family transcriptional regulator [Crenobacter cavernae]